MSHLKHNTIALHVNEDEARSRRRIRKRGPDRWVDVQTAAERHESPVAVEWALKIANARPVASLRVRRAEPFWVGGALSRGPCVQGSSTRSVRGVVDRAFDHHTSGRRLRDAPSRP
jgi:hypothetical protein